MLTVDWEKAANRISRDVQKIFAVYLSEWTVTKLIFAVRRLMICERPSPEARILNPFRIVFVSRVILLCSTFDSLPRSVALARQQVFPSRVLQQTIGDPWS